MEKTLRMSLLFDFYGALLTERQQDVFQLYFGDDLSLGEIAEELRISRQAVYDTLRRVGLILEEWAWCRSTKSGSAFMKSCSRFWPRCAAAAEICLN